MGYASEVLADTPTLYWKLDETSGTTAGDSSGAGRNGAHSGGVVLGALSLDNEPGGSAYYDGVNDVTTIAWNAAFAAGAAGATYEIWYRGIGTPGVELGIFSANTSSTVKRFVLVMTTTGVAAFKMVDNSGSYFTITGTIPINDDRWHHLAGVIEASTYDALLYVDGVLDASDATPASGGGQGSPNVLVGRDGRSANYMKGLHAHAAIYNKSLSAARILAHYQAGKGAPAWANGSRSPMVMG